MAKMKELTTRDVMRYNDEMVRVIKENDDLPSIEEMSIRSWRMTQAQAAIYAGIFPDIAEDTSIYDLPPAQVIALGDEFGEAYEKAITIDPN